MIRIFPPPEQGIFSAAASTNKDPYIHNQTNLNFKNKSSGREKFL
jgi:hypothetical protein